MGWIWRCLWLVKQSHHTHTQHTESSCKYDIPFSFYVFCSLSLSPRISIDDIHTLISRDKYHATKTYSLSSISSINPFFFVYTQIASNSLICCSRQPIKARLAYNSRLPRLAIRVFACRHLKANFGAALSIHDGHKLWCKQATSDNDSLCI